MVVCISAAQRRALLTFGMKPLDKVSVMMIWPVVLELSGLGQLAEACLLADRFIRVWLTV